MDCMSRRELIDELPIRPDDNVCTGCYLVPPEWYRGDDGTERCSECDDPRSEGKPALTLSEQKLQELVHGV